MVRFHPRPPKFYKRIQRFHSDIPGEQTFFAMLPEMAGDCRLSVCYKQGLDRVHR